jgi:serine/threonine protein kinase
MDAKNTRNVEIYNESLLKKKIPIFTSGESIAGGQGGIHSPPFPCPNVDRYFLSPKFVGKTFRNYKHFKHEKQIQMDLKRIDPKRLCTIQMVDYCKIYEKFYDESLTLEKYGLEHWQYRDVRPNQRIHYYRESGQIIYPLADDLQLFQDLAFQDLNKGLAIILFFLKSFGHINDQGLYHQDLSLPNIMFSKDKGLLMTIDFGYANYGINKLHINKLHNEYGRSKIRHEDKIIPPEFIFLYFLLSRITDGKNFEKQHMMNDNKYEFSISPILSRFVPATPLLNKQSFVSRNKLLKVFTFFSDIYKKKPNVDDVKLFKPHKKNKFAELYFGAAHSPLYDQLIPEVISFQQTRDPTGILRLMDTPHIRNRYDVIGIAHQILPFLVSFFYRFKRNRDILSVFLKVVINDMLQPDVYKRLSVTESFQKIFSILENSFPAFFGYYMDFQNFTERNGKSPFGLMTQDEIEREYEADRILLAKENQKRTRRNSRAANQHNLENQQNQVNQVIAQLANNNLTPTPLCRGLQEYNCKEKQDCLYVDKTRRYCRRKGRRVDPSRPRRVIDLSMFPCRGKLAQECTQIEDCLWRDQTAKMKAHCRKKRLR